MLAALVAASWMVAGAAQPQAEKQLVATVAGPDLKGGIISEITWDGGVLMIQGVFVEPGGDLKAQYFVAPADGIALEKRDAQTERSLQYWQKKSSRRSPTGYGPIETNSDTKMPQFGLGSLERRLGDAHDMGGTQTTIVLKLGRLVLFERSGPAPYDGETWSWSPAELNRIAYVDGGGDLWVARADGREPRRVARGDYTLPAWSDDGRTIAVAERRDGGRRWDISLIHLPPPLRAPR